MKSWLKSEATVDAPFNYSLYSPFLSLSLFLSASNLPRDFRNASLCDVQLFHLRRVSVEFQQIFGNKCQERMARKLRLIHGGK